MTTFVLVPGYWLGAWAWQPVTQRLRAAGHTVYPLSLTGLGERAHLGGPDVNLETHIADIVNLLRYEDLHDVVLVGHSGEGVALTGAADRVPERLAQLVYVDSAPVPDGTAQIELYPPEQRALYERRVADQGDGSRFEMPPWEELDQGNQLDGLGEAERAAIRARIAAEPFAVATQPLRVSNPQRTQVPGTIIWCTFDKAAVDGILASGNPFWSALVAQTWQFRYLRTGHWPMFSAPAALAELLLEVAERTP